MLQDGLDGDLAQAGLGLGAADVSARVGQIDVAPQQSGVLVGARSGEHERGDLGEAVADGGARGGVQCSRRVQQGLDVDEAVKVHGPAAKA